MNLFDRRQFIKNSLGTGAALSIAHATGTALAAATTPPAKPAPLTKNSPGIIDTNVTLFQWPFRKLKYSETPALVAKLRQHHIIEAWAGSFEALLHKDIAGVNERLATECREQAPGFLRPFGTVNLAWADWEEDVRRCHEVHHMPGLRIYPGYQPFNLKHPGLAPLIAMVRERGLILQIVFQMEDPRVHHPLIKLETLDARPLIAPLQAAPGAKVQLLHFSGNVQGSDLQALMAETPAHLDLSRWEGNGAIGRMIGSAPSGSAARVPLERVFFGSHAPYFPVETAVLKLMESPLDRPQLNAIMQGNARRWLPPV